MKELTYNGKRYFRTGVKWTDASGMVAPVAVQSALNRMAVEEIPLDDLTFDEAVKEGDALKASESYSLALRFYEHAMKVAECYEQVSPLLPRITSAYRKLHRPEKVIEIFTEVSRTYGARVTNTALLTSAGAAYLDLGKPEEALRCCRRAYAILKSRKAPPSGELSGVFGRAMHMLDPHYKYEEDVF